MKKLTMVFLSFLLIGITSVTAQTKTEETEQSLDDIFWKSKSFLLDTCTDSTIDHMKKDQKKFDLLEFLTKHKFSYNDIARCGCKILIKKYPKAHYEELDSLGDLEGIQLIRECTSDEFLWDIFLEGLSTSFGKKQSICIIESLRDNISLDEFLENMKYYTTMYATECRKLLKDRIAPNPDHPEIED